MKNRRVKPQYKMNVSLEMILPIPMTSDSLHANEAAMDMLDNRIRTSKCGYCGRRILNGQETAVCDMQVIESQIIPMDEA